MLWYTRKDFSDELDVFIIISVHEHVSAVKMVAEDIPEMWYMSNRLYGVSPHKANLYSNAIRASTIS